mgnify:FL=1
MREEDEEPDDLSQISKAGYGGILCIETGGPTPGLGCAGRGIIATFQLLEDMELFERLMNLLNACDDVDKIYHNVENYEGE